MTSFNANTTPIVLYFRNDLRLSAHPALFEALKLKRPIVFVYILDTDQKTWPKGGASKWWLHESLRSLDLNLKSMGSRLILRHGEPLKELEEILTTTNANTIFWSRRYEPQHIANDLILKNNLKQQGYEVESFNASLLMEPWQLLNGQKKPYQVFTPYWKALQAQNINSCVYRLPSELMPVSHWPTSLSLNDLNLLPQNTWYKKLSQYWQPGETHALKKLKYFLDDHAQNYKLSRDFPHLNSTSKLSPHLHFGEISPQQIWDMAHKNSFFTKAKSNADPSSNDVLHFLREIAWRDFSYSLLYHFPTTPTEPLNQKFKNFPWQKNKSALKAWQTGQTGYPIVDAGMRELWETGFMHNRVRMIVASFLTKDLLIAWQDGAQWFWDTLVDADLANNTQGWQWTAGCGADAAPYFRIFNPILQSEKFDAEGLYIKKWVPELKKLESKWVHKPFLAPADVLTKAGVVLGQNYPHPLVDHAQARDRALDIWKQLK